MVQDSITPLPFRFDSSQFSGREAFERWRDEASITHDVSKTPVGPDPFHISARMWRFPSCIVTGASFSAQTFARTTQHVRRDHLDHYGLFAQGQGSREFVINETEETLHTGDLQIFDLAQAELSSATAGSSGTLFLPRDLVDRVFPGFSDLHGTVLRTRQARMLAAHIVAMHTYLEAIPPEGVDGFLACTLSLAFDTLGAYTATATAPNASLSRNLEGLRFQIDRHLDANLGDLLLSPETVAAHFNLSRSALYRLFEADGGVVRYLREKRLKRIHDILARGTEERPLFLLAEDYGFISGSSLRRAFRDYYGYTPSDLRESTHTRIASLASAPGAAPTMRSLFVSPLDQPNMISG